MDRRQFLSSTVLSGLGLAAARPATAFTLGECSDTATDSACRELVRHDDQITRLNALLADKGLDAEARKALLATARCQFCGSLLIG